MQQLLLCSPQALWYGCQSSTGDVNLRSCVRQLLCICAGCIRAYETSFCVDKVRICI